MLLSAAVGAKVSFLSWMRFSLPICALLLLVSWKLLLTNYPPLLAQLETDRLHAASSFTNLNSRQIVACLTTVCTVLCWALWKQLHLEAVFGAMGVVGLVPIILFCSLGLLDRRGFHQELNWSVLILIGGGLALGHVMQRSFLLEIMSGAVETFFQGAGLWTFMMAFCMIMAVVGNFMSSTVAAIVILPVVANIGQTIGHPSALIVSCVLMNCCAMALPVSSFPNANSFAVTRKLRPRSASQGVEGEGEEGAKAAAAGPILSVKDYLATGGIITLLALPVMGTLGYLSVSVLE